MIVKKIYQELSDLVQKNNYNQTSKQRIIMLMQKLAENIAEEKDIDKVIDYICAAGNTCPELSFDLLKNGKLKYTIWIYKNRFLKVELKSFSNGKMVNREFLDLKNRKEVI